MRRSGRALALVLLTLLSSIVLGVASAMTAAFTLAATALIVPGTGTHNVTTNTQYREQARDRFMGLTPCATSCTGDNLIGVDYPATFFPIPIGQWCPGLSCDTWNVSVGTGVTNLDGELDTLLTSDDPEAAQIVIFGYSQGGAVVSHAMAEHIAGLTDDQKARTTVVTIGNIENPQGLWSRFGSWTIPPPLDITFGPHLPTDIGVTSYNYDFEYDPVGDAPLYLLNPLALLNALAAFQYVHGYYLSPNDNDPDGTLPYGYTDKTLAAAIANAPIQSYQNANFILIPWQGTLPLFQPLIDLGNSTGTSAFIRPIVDLLQPATKVLIDLAYDRTANPGIPQTFKLFPIVNPVKLTADLIHAGIEGVQAFIGDLAPAPPGTTTNPSNPSILAPPKVEVPQQQTGQTEVSLAANSQQTLKTVKPEVTKGAVSTQDLPNLSSLAPRHQPLKAKSPNLFRPHATKAPEPGASQRRSKDLTTTGGPSTNDNSAVDSTTPVKAPKAAKAAA